MSHIGRILGRVILATVLVLVAACSTDETPYIERSVDEIYNTAMDLLADDELQLAAAEFEEVERQHPYSRWASRAQLMAAFAYYQDANYLATIAAAERYTTLYPSGEGAAYAYYLIAQSHYEQISDVKRDQSKAQNAREGFRNLLRQFPDSRYGRDSELKLELTEDHLAGKEMDIGRWYQSRNRYLAAINRFRNVVVDYQTTTHVAEALLRLVETYLSIGAVDQARKAAAVLGHNFRGSDWYDDAYRLLALHNLLPDPDASGDLPSL